MGLTKQYLRYAPSGVFNIIASGDCNSTHVALNGVSGRYVAVGACEHVIIWDMRLGEKVLFNCLHLSSYIFCIYFITIM